MKPPIAKAKYTGKVRHFHFGMVATCCAWIGAAEGIPLGPPGEPPLRGLRFRALTMAPQTSAGRPYRSAGTAARHRAPAGFESRSRVLHRFVPLRLCGNRGSETDLHSQRR